ncbi:DNA cytosine methyltransferase [Arabiibacter massiliensis]|uniref:DNA cytosine methyltransferase n=1 Tax=Arabiibacter massiliensis TaxID=1870985 RepID=UPI0009BC4968|nr:DNA cytosine methyltransferase [Arabiibacter massiliensis]
MTKPTVVSLFAGAGGLDLGFVQAGFDLVWANDFDSDAVETYRMNLGDHIVCGDIASLSTDDIPDCDVLIGGFPCQGFSVANRKRSTADERNLLYKEYLRILHAKRPKVFLAENVKGILSLDGGAVIDMIVSDFQSEGYNVKYRLINAADYGVPQKRMRVIIVGTREDIAEEFEYPAPSHSGKVQDGLSPWVTMREALEGVPDPDGPMSDTVPNNVYSRYKVEPRNFTGHRPSDADKPSPTILARGNGGGGVCAIPHYNGERRLSVRESACIQTFPMEYSFYGKMNSCYRQIGNAVPVLLARELASQIRKLLPDE